MNKTTYTVALWAFLICTTLTNQLTARSSSQSADVEFVIVEELPGDFPEKINDIYQIADILARIVLENGNEVYMVEHIVARIEDNNLKEKVVKFLAALAQLKREQRNIKKIQALTMIHFGAQEARRINDHMIKKAIGNGIVGAVARYAPIAPSVDLNRLHEMLDRWNSETAPAA